MGDNIVKFWKINWFEYLKKYLRVVDRQTMQSAEIFFIL